jgi:hypothetical protein
LVYSGEAVAMPLQFDNTFNKIDSSTLKGSNGFYEIPSRNFTLSFDFDYKTMKPLNLLEELCNIGGNKKLSREEINNKIKVLLNTIQ